MRKLAGTLFFIALLLSPQSSLFAIQADSTSKIKGTIRAVDLDGGTVTINPRRGDSAVVLKVNERTEIIRNGEPARLGDLQPGDRATAVFDTSSMIASRIDARGPEGTGSGGELARIEGTIASVSPADSTVTIEPISRGPSVTLHVGSRTEITLDGRPARLEELQRGFAAAASYNPSNLEAARIAAESFAEVRGLIRDVDPAGSTLSIQPSSGEPVTLHVGPDTAISLNDRPARLEDLKRGFRVVASFVQSTHLALRVAAQSAGEVTGHIRSVDLGNASLVIVPLVDGPSIELHVTHSTAITVGGERADLSDLKPGMAVHATFDVSTLEALTVEARPLDGSEDCTLVRIAGVIADVDPRAATVTIDPGDSTPRVTLNVTPRTEIEVDGREARLSDLSSGMHAEAEFCRETGNAKHIAARTGTGGGECTPARVAGVIARVDLDGGHVTISTGPETPAVTLNVTPRTEIVVNGRPARLSDLTAGMRVEAQYCRETHDAQYIAARSGER